jgi:hypothetical protein
MSIFDYFEHVVVIEVLQIVNASHLHKHVRGLLLLGDIDLDDTIDQRLLCFRVGAEGFKVGELGEEANSPCLYDEIGLFSFKVFLDCLDQRLHLNIPLVS